MKGLAAISYWSRREVRMKLSDSSSLGRLVGIVIILIEEIEDA